MLKQWFGMARRAYNTSVVVHKAKKGDDIYEGVKRTASEVKRDPKKRKACYEVRKRQKGGTCC